MTGLISLEIHIDWTEICDGRIDCLNDGIDEKDCWQLEISQCNQNEYRCSNGECISILFNEYDTLLSDCSYHEVIAHNKPKNFGVCHLRYHSFDECDNLICPYSPLTSSCSTNRQYYAFITMYINDNNSLSSDSWLSLTCYLNLTLEEYQICRRFCDQNDCIEIINRTYHEYIFFPQNPILFENIYFIYMKREIMNTTNPRNIYGFNGTRCQYDRRICTPTKCWNDGVCNETSDTTFQCLCQPGWSGQYCQTMINDCDNVICENNGICRPIFQNFTCECLGDSFYGQYCEYCSTKITILKTTSRSIAYVYC